MENEWRGRGSRGQTGALTLENTAKRVGPKQSGLLGTAEEQRSSQHGTTAAVLEEDHYGMALGSEYQVCNTRLSLQPVNALKLLEKCQCL